MPGGPAERIGPRVWRMLRIGVLTTLLQVTLIILPPKTSDKILWKLGEKSEGLAHHRTISL
jgi:hypothetical protein